MCTQMPCNFIVLVTDKLYLYFNAVVYSGEKKFLIMLLLCSNIMAANMQSQIHFFFLMNQFGNQSG